MKVIIVTGLSGAGKTQAMDVLEDMGYRQYASVIDPELPGYGRKEQGDRARSLRD